MYKRKWAWGKLDENEVEKFAQSYKDFLAKAKTEREAVSFIVSELRKNGFKEAREVTNLSPGDKVYTIYKNKMVIAAVIGDEEITKGFRLVGAHIDVPRLDVKPLPIYEDSGIVLLKTHYYGGIKKYQWVNIPLAIHGVVALKDGTKKEIVIGEEENDPVFVIPDLLPHLARKKQGERKAFDTIKGEELRVILGNKPENPDKEEKDSVKKAILKLLEEKYGIKEEDLAEKIEKYSI